MEPEKKSHGALIGSIIIIIILIIGGLYIWQSKVKNAIEKKQVPPATPITIDPNELDNLEQDLGTVDTDIDADVNPTE